MERRPHRDSRGELTSTADARRTVETYRDARERIIEFIRAIPEEYMDRAVPATPLWTGRQLVAHLVGGSEDFANMNLPSAGVSFEQWTANQVARRDGLS